MELNQLAALYHVNPYGTSANKAKKKPAQGESWQNCLNNKCHQGNQQKLGYIVILFG